MAILEFCKSALFSELSIPNRHSTLPLFFVPFGHNPSHDTKCLTLGHYVKSLRNPLWFKPEYHFRFLPFLVAAGL